MSRTPMYFGRPGSLFEIPHPRGGVRSTRERPVSVFKTAAGGARVGITAGGVRQYALSWEQLWYETFYLLESFDQGHEGPGPFALIDPGRINMLTVNQSSATSHLNGTDNFTVAGSGGTISSSLVTYNRGPRSLAWNSTFASSGALTLDSPTSDWPGIPVVASVALTFSLYGKGGGTDAVMSVTPKLEWADVNGSVLSTDSGTPLTTNSSAFQVASVTATPPANAVYVLCKVDATGQSAGSILYLDSFQLEAASSASSWRPGTGVIPVAVVSLAEEWPWEASTFRRSPVLTLQEVT
jgi:hypothetical protein